MAESSPQEIVEKYFDLFTAKRYTEVRALLSDRFSFRGPIDRFDNPEDYIAALQQLGPVAGEVRKRKVFADGGDVAVFYDFTLAPTGQVLPIAEWHRVDGGKIQSLQLIFDARHLLALAPPS